jgi:hypothetical protein
MRSIKQYLLVTLGFGLAGAIGAAFGTGTAQAVVASLVEVVNPNTSPVPTLSVTDPGRIAYQAELSTVLSSADTTIALNSTNVPTGHRVVIQHIAVEFSFTGVPNGVEVAAISNVTPASHFFAPVLQQAPSPFYVAGLDQPVLFYIESGTSATVVAVVYGSAAEFLTNSSQIVVLTGYELDCTVATCAPIATQ